MTVAAASSFYVEQVRKVTVLCFTTRALCEQNYEVVADELLEFVTLVTAERPIRVVAELSSVYQIDDLGLAMLQAFNDSIDDAGGTLILCRVQASVMAAITKAGLRCEFNFRDTRGEAMWSF
jgi:anti-anti-sigma regulatory factor